MILSRHDLNGLAAIRTVEPTKYFVLPENPTAENMARYLFETVCPELLADYAVRAVRVVLWETPETCAIVGVDEGAFTGMFPANATSATTSVDSRW